MKTLNETDALNELIIATEKKAAYELVLLKEQFHTTYESFKPMNLIKNAFHDLTASPELNTNMVSDALGVGSGLLSKKILTGNSNNIFRKVLGNVAQFAVASLVSKNTGGIVAMGANLLNGFLNKTKDKTETEKNLPVSTNT